MANMSHDDLFSKRNEDEHWKSKLPSDIAQNVNFRNRTCRWSNELLMWYAVYFNGKRTTQGVEITREPGIRLILVVNCLKSFRNSAKLKVVDFDGVI